MTQVRSQKISQNLNFTVEGQDLQTLVEFSDTNTENSSTKTEIILKPNTRLNYAFGLFGGQSIQKNLHFKLQEGAELNLIGVFLGTENQEHKVKATIEHLGPNSNSQITVKGILKDQAHNRFQGLIKINKEAQHSNAALEQRVLLLSREALAEGQPELEILANDVKAAHAAAVGRVNPEQIFYMTSRGISPKQAKEMIVKGFLESLIQSIPAEDARNHLEKLFLEKIAA